MKNYLFGLGSPAAIFAALSCAVLVTPVSAQNGYKAPAAYGASTAAPTVEPVAVAAPRSSPTPSPPAGKPLPAAPMPMAQPSIDKVQTAVDQSVPMTPEEITRLLTTIYERQTASQQNVTGKPQSKPVTSAETLDLSPGATPPVVRVSLGQGTVLSFSDSAGRAWPIQDNLNFNDRAYQAKLIGPHLYSITLKSREAANVTVVLKDLPRPIVVTILPAGDETDYLKEYTVPRFLGGEPPPNVAASSREGAFSFNAPELLNYLYKTPPKGARTLTVAGLPNVMVWQTVGNKMIVRTAGQVVIPAFSRRHASTDGMAVFEVPLSPVISITEGGALHRVAIGGYAVETAGADSATK